MNITDLVKKVAPWMGAALGGPGPLGVMAIQAAAKALGATEETIESVQKAITGATPEQLLSLKQSDQEFALRMQELGFKNSAELEKIAADDRDSARKMQMANKSTMPAIISAGLLASFAGTLIALMSVPIPLDNRDMIIYMVGQLSGFAGSAVAFWLGTTRQSEEKTHMLNDKVKKDVAI